MTFVSSPRGICTLATWPLQGISTIAVVALVGGTNQCTALVLQWSVHHNSSGTSSTRQCLLVQPCVGRAYHEVLDDLDVLYHSRYLDVRIVVGDVRIP